MMTYTEMEQILQFNDYESKIFMPNEIFSDLQNNINNPSHVAFAYSYIYFVTWAYRYAKYGTVNELIDQKFIKKILGYNENYKKLDYLIKQNGILEQMDYIRTEKDYPVAYSYDKIDGLQFQYIDDFKEYTEYIKTLNVPKNYKIKFPVKAFYRDKESEGDYYEDGTFFYFDRTHLVPFEAFIFCMTNEDLGCTGFYLYAFLRSKTQIFDGYDASIEKLIEYTGIPERTLYRYLDALKKHNMIQCYFDKEFIAGLPKEERRANTYYVNEDYMFSDTVRPYKKRGFKTLKQYEWDKLLKEEMQEQVQQQMEFLPQKNEN